MKIPCYNFKSYIELYNLGDIHRGNKTCDTDLFNKIIHKIKTKKNAFWISSGDIMEVALKTSKSSVYGAMDPQQELETVIKELSPIANKCLGIVKSNHHARLERDTGISLDKSICLGLGIDKFLGGVGVIRIICGSTPYYVSIFHGTGGGRTMGAKVNGLDRLKNIVPGVDIYCTGHTHTFSHHMAEMNYVDKKRCNFKSYKANFVCTGHFLEWDKSYAQDMGLEPMPLGAAKMVLKDGKTGRYEDKDVEVSLSY